MQNEIWNLGAIKKDKTLNLTQRLTRKVPPRGWKIPNLDFCAIG